MRLCLRLHFCYLTRKNNLSISQQAHIHHYTQVDGMDAGEFSESLESLTELINEYETLEKQMHNPPPVVPRLQIAS